MVIVSISMLLILSARVIDISTYRSLKVAPTSDKVQKVGSTKTSFHTTKSQGGYGKHGKPTYHKKAYGWGSGSHHTTTATTEANVDSTSESGTENPFSSLYNMSYTKHSTESIFSQTITTNTWTEPLKALPNGSYGITVKTPSRQRGKTKGTEKSSNPSSVHNPKTSSTKPQPLAPHDKKTTNRSKVLTPLEKALYFLIAETRLRAAFAYENSKARWTSAADNLRQHLMWLGLLAPLAVLCAYIVFVVVSRTSKPPPAPGDAENSFRAPVVVQQPRRLSISELKRRNWIRRRRPVGPQCFDEFDKKDFHQSGPLVLTKELVGEVKFADAPKSTSILKVQFDKDLNEMVDIGSKIEVVPKTQETPRSVEQNVQRESPIPTTSVDQGLTPTTTQGFMHSTEQESDKETQHDSTASVLHEVQTPNAAFSKVEMHTGLGTTTPEREGNVEGEANTAFAPTPKKKKSRLEMIAGKVRPSKTTKRVKSSLNVATKPDSHEEQKTAFNDR